MALKDWKKVANENIWVSTEKHRMIDVKKVCDNPYYSTYWLGERYMFVLSNTKWPLNVIKRIGFKTKISALKYARKYIRK